ncbi:nucleoside phosphorylase [Compostibacter hankyongensis]|uniref:Uridine phosphorylase n=1 Tax=Compostibacter hankyongensis TaxID=1007089 RepID=A0ABP8FPF5_9BACT
MTVLAASEMILNERGAVYHLNLRPEELAPLVITVGDPDRVKEVSAHFDRVEWQTAHREFVTHTGYIGPQRISVVSTGIGTDNIDIVLTELDALVNIDLEERRVKKQHTALKIIRMGTCGGLQPDIPTDGLVVSVFGIGMDNLLHFYRRETPPEEQRLLDAFTTHVSAGNAVHPYIAGADSGLLERFGEKDFIPGITVTCPGFYGPQGRRIRAVPAFPDLQEQLCSFVHEGRRITNFEMETAGIYGMGRLLGHACLSISTVVANRSSGTFSADGRKAVKRMIERSLAVLPGI